MGDIWITEEGLEEIMTTPAPLWPSPVCPWSEHEWIGSGFPGGMMWCKKCDTDMPSWVRKSYFGEEED